MASPPEHPVVSPDVATSQFDDAISQSDDAITRPDAAMTRSDAATTRPDTATTRSEDVLPVRQKRTSEQHPLASRAARPGQSRPDAQTPPTEGVANAAELSHQFEVIRQVLEARRAAEREADVGAGAGTGIGATADPVVTTPDRPRRMSPAPVTSSPAKSDPNPAKPGPSPAKPSLPRPRREEPARPTVPAAAHDYPTLNRAYAPAPTSGSTSSATPTPTPTPIPAPTSVFTSPSMKRRGPRRGGRFRVIAGVFVVFALLFCASVAVYAVTHRQSVVTTVNPPPTSSAPTPAAVDAADWVATTVGSSQVVACDVSVCSLLRSQGFPTTSLITVRLGLSDVEQADAVVLTPVLRAQLGSGVNAVLSTEPLAVFGTGADQVEVAAVALAGPTAYAQNLSADRASRRAAGQALLGNVRLILTTPAKTLLANGLVDTRVCALLALLAGSHTIVVAGFTPIPPGAGPDVPSAGLLVETVDGQPAAGTPTSPVQHLLLATVQAQQDPYSPMSAAPGSLDGAQGLLIVYSQPGPLGLLAGATS